MYWWAEPVRASTGLHEGRGARCRVMASSVPSRRRWRSSTSGGRCSSYASCSPAARGSTSCARQPTDVTRAALEEAGHARASRGGPPGDGGRACVVHPHPSGEDLREVVMALGAWGTRWIGELGDEDLDPHLLMWDIRRHVPVEEWPRTRTVGRGPLRRRARLGVGMVAGREPRVRSTSATSTPGSTRWRPSAPACAP